MTRKTLTIWKGNKMDGKAITHLEKAIAALGDAHPMTPFAAAIVDYLQEGATAFSGGTPKPPPPTGPN